MMSANVRARHYRPGAVVSGSCSCHIDGLSDDVARVAIVACPHASRQSEGAGGSTSPSRGAGSLSLEELQIGHLEECRHAIKYGRPIEARLAPGGGEGRPARHLRTSRRNRKADWTRRLVAETMLTVDDLIWPLFLVDGSKTRAAVRRCPESNGSRSTRRCASRASAKLRIPCLALFSLHRSEFARRRRHRST